MALDLHRADIFRLRALLALRDVKLDGLAFVQLLVTLRLDRRVVGEDVRTAPSGAMNPNPFSALNHFTVPVARLWVL